MLDLWARINQIEFELIGARLAAKKSICFSQRIERGPVPGKLLSLAFRALMRAAQETHKASATRNQI